MPNRNETFAADARRDETTPTRDGVRKTAVFLSILDDRAANELLARLDPAVARAVAAEMPRVANLAPEEIDAIVAEFLALDAKSAAETSVDAPSTVAEVRAATENFASVPIPESGARPTSPPIQTSSAALNQTANGGSFFALDAFDAKTLANVLRDERPSTIAVVASRLSEKKRDEFLRATPRELAEAASRRAAALERTTETSQLLEDAVFDRALNDE